MLGPDSGIRPGTILVCWSDCGYLRVDGVTAEGVICRSAFGPHLYTWKDLEYHEAAIDSHPGSSEYVDAEVRARPPRLISRGGKVNLKNGKPSIDMSGLDRNARQVDLKIIKALLSTADKEWQEISLRIDEVEFKIEKVNASTAVYEAKLTSA